jgi:Secretion system C-terminal sorting domain
LAILSYRSYILKRIRYIAFEMKKTLYILFAFSANLALGQSVTLNPKDISKGGVNAADPSGNYNIEVESRITNNSSDSMFIWEIIELSQPSAWQLDFCDPFYCRTGATQGDKFEFKMRQGQSGWMKADYIFNNTSGSGVVKVAIYAKNNTSNADTLTVRPNSWVTSVNEVSKTNTFRFYPNPVKDQLHIKFAASNPVRMELFNILGVKVKSFTHEGQLTSIPVGDLQNGVYFIRFEENGKWITKQFTKVQ